jgi:hypothetical protein
MLGGLYQKECGGNYPLDTNNNINMGEVESGATFWCSRLISTRLPLPPIQIIIIEE